MHAVYLDTEFTQLSLDRRLISLALVDAAGAEFYTELSDGWSTTECSEFVHQIVLPQLDLERHGRPRAEAGDALAWDWPLLVCLLEPLGLPANVRGCRQVDDPLGELPCEDIPHHALLDARLLRDLCEAADV